MKTIVVKHPLRELTYQTQDTGFPSQIEIDALEKYRRAHDEAWRMKLRFEKERGEVLLAQIEVNKLNENMEDLERIRKHYLREIDFTDETALRDLYSKLQIEIRDFYNQAQQQRPAVVKFFDRIGPLNQAYTDIINTYIRKLDKKPLDPLQFNALDDIFRFHDDMEVEIDSLDKDLQAFLQVLTDIYTLLDDYLEQYNVLHTAYSNALQRSVELAESVQIFNKIWD